MPDQDLDSNDLVVFIDGFFGGQTWSDMAGPGAEPGGDGVFDSNDFVVFVNFFFSPCFMIDVPSPVPNPPFVLWPI